MTNLFSNLDNFEDKIMKAVSTGLGEAIEKLAKQSLKEAPLDENPLRESMQIIANNKVIGKGTAGGTVAGSGQVPIADKLEISISYDTEYAIIQHEEMSFNHPTPGTKAKYLEDPFNQHVSTIENELIKGIKKVTK